MGRVTTKVTIENLEDVWALRRGKMNSEQVRRVEVPNALVDTGAVALSLPTRIIQELGLVAIGIKNTITASGPAKTTQYDAVRITIQDRSCTVDVLEVPVAWPHLGREHDFAVGGSAMPTEEAVIIGPIPPSLMDFIVDPVNRQLIWNPDHGGLQVFEVF